MIIYDVVISGAGPVGLFLACELALGGCSVLVLEKAEPADSPLKRLPFGMRGLSAPTVEALCRRDLLRELMVPQRLKDPFGQPAKAPSRRQAGHFAGIPFYFEDLDTARWHRLPSDSDTMLLSEMEELETVLGRRALALGVVVRRGAGVTGLHQTTDSVVVESDHGSFRGLWLVGCDGSRSVVRKEGGFEFAGTEPEFTGYSTQLEIADPEKLAAGRTLTPTGMYFQSQPGFLVMQEFDDGAAHGAQAVTREQVQQVLRRVSNTDVTVSALQVATTWTDRARQATSYRNGRLLLAGDAAHIHAPLGGQGLNLGIGDAMNLGWKLAATLQGRAPHGLLDSYHSERHPIGAQVLEWSRAQVAAMRPDPHARALSAVLRELMATRDGATYMAERIRGVSMHYDLGGGHPLVGHSVPNFKLEDGTTIAELMHDGRGMLLDFGMDAALKTWVGEYGGRIKYVAGRAGRQPSGLNAALVRPDGFVAWAADQRPDLAQAQRAAAAWFAAPPR
jgi:2-polyprenyl-6-methoxyphenol hydroxylase-like FAD-dependent oxidoreductase